MIRFFRRAGLFLLGKGDHIKFQEIVKNNPAGIDHVHGIMYGVNFYIFPFKKGLQAYQLPLAPPPPKLPPPKPPKDPPPPLKDPKSRPPPMPPMKKGGTPPLPWLPVVCPL